MAQKNYEKLLTELMKKDSPKQIGKAFIFKLYYRKRRE